MDSGSQRIGERPACSILPATLLFARRARWLLSALLFTLWLCPAIATQYAYDSAGRLTQVVEADGSAIQYSYDADGNILSITRTGGTGAIGIDSISPASGAVGTSVAIHGYGFDSTAALDSVQFNGIAATVTSASTSTLIVVVPPGATTGPISVTATAGSATSADTFTITNVSITGFAPAVGAPGTVVTIAGSGFDPTAANNNVTFGSASTAATSATATQLQATVPAGATTAHIGVATPGGLAMSAADFIVPPSGIAPSSIAMTGQLAPGGPGLVYTLNTANAVGGAFFDGTAGQRVTLVMTNVTLGGTFKIYAPDGTLFYSNQPSDNTTFDLPPLPASGTYSLYLTPGTSKGTATIRFATDALGTIATDGTPLPLVLQSGQNASFTFGATAGVAYNLAITGFTSNPAGGSVTAKILKPDGTVLANCGSFTASSQGCRFVAAASTAYTLRLDAGGLYATTFTARITQDVTGTLTAGDPPLSLNLVPGGNATFTFTATAGQNLALRLSSVVISPAGNTAMITVTGSSGTQVVSQSTSAAITFNMAKLAAGTYTVLVVPYNASAASMNLTLASQVGGVAPLDGTSASYSTTLPGQRAYFTFSGTAGQTIALALTGVTFTPNTSAYASVYVYTPSGATLNSDNPVVCYGSSASCQRSFYKLPATGTYSITVIPPSTNNQMAFTLTLSPAVTAVLSVGGAAQPLTFASPGQNAVVSFTVTAGQTVALNTSSIATTPANAQVNMWIYNPGGSQINSVSGTTTMTLNMKNLAAGTYQVLIDSSAAVTGSVTVQVADQTGGPAPLDGTGATYSTAVPGQSAYFTFPGTAGQTIAVTLTGVTFTPNTSAYASMYVYTPTGTTINSGDPIVCYGSGASCQRTFKLATTGTYSIAVVAPDIRNKMSFTLTLSPAVTSAITVGNPAQLLTLASPGQNAVLTFSATAGQTVAVNADSIVSVPAGQQFTMQVYNSAGTLINSVSSSPGNMTLNLTNLAADTYSVLIDPHSGVTATMNVQVASQMGGTIAADGTTGSYSAAVRGQRGYFKFAATAGQTVSVAVSGVTFTPSYSGTLNVGVYQPSGSSLGSSIACNSSNNGVCAQTFRNLPVTGTYSITAFPPSADIATGFGLTVAPAVTGTLTLGAGSQNISLPSLGQAALLTLTTTATQTVHVNVNSIVSTPVTGQYTMNVYNASGTSVGSANAGSNSSMSATLTNLAAGTYTILIRPSLTSSATMSVSAN